MGDVFTSVSVAIAKCQPEIFMQHIVAQDAATLGNFDKKMRL